MFTVQTHEHQAGQGHVHQCQQFVEAAATGTDHLTQGRKRALQPFQVSAVTRNREEGLTQVLAHCDNPLWCSIQGVC
ncbi:hypothetical protein D3C85_1616680 [compost metagenome]